MYLSLDSTRISLICFLFSFVFRHHAMVCCHVADHHIRMSFSVVIAVTRITRERNPLTHRPLRCHCAVACRYVARLHPRSSDDMKNLMRLQNGLLRHVQQELMDHEKEVQVPTASAHHTVLNLRLRLMFWIDCFQPN
jgi:hypothetical protein